MTYRPYLSRVTRDNWKLVLIFPVALLFGAGLAGWTLFDFLSFVQAMRHGAARLVWDPVGVRMLAIGLALAFVGILPLFPVPDAHPRRALAGSGIAVKALAVLCALAIFFGPALVQPVLQSYTATNGYRQCPMLDHRYTTLRWVKLANGSRQATCPQRWQDEG